MMNFLAEFDHELKQPHPRPEYLALTIAGLANPKLNISQCLAQLDEMATRMGDRLIDLPPGRARAEQFLQLFNQELGFAGNHDHYYDPANSLLDVVLQRRVGLPIMLSLLCMTLGRRIGFNIVGIGFPGHFMARYEDSVGAWLLDPFNGNVVECLDAQDYLSQLFHRSVQLLPAMNAPVSAAMLAQRILNNLRNVYLNRRDYRLAVLVLDYLLILQPADESLWQERGLLHFYSEQWEAAARDLKRYFFLSGQLQFVFSSNDDLPSPPTEITATDRQLFDIYKQIESIRRRLN
jgi:regulator of sirC expression with transglutaminase-like and TPR domain